jgi:hypothetical protein
MVEDCPSERVISLRSLFAITPIHRSVYVTLLVTLLVTSGWLRFYGLRWDQRQSLHPDESIVILTALEHVHLDRDTSIQEILDPRSSPLNPRTSEWAYVYGLLPIYLDKTAYHFVRPTTDDIGPGDFPYFGIQDMGRALAALIDTVTVVLVACAGLLL